MAFFLFENGIVGFATQWKNLIPEKMQIDFEIRRILDGADKGNMRRKMEELQNYFKSMALPDGRPDMRRLAIAADVICGDDGHAKFLAELKAGKRSNNDWISMSRKEPMRGLSGELMATHAELVQAIENGEFGMAYLNNARMALETIDIKRQILRHGMIVAAPAWIARETRIDHRLPPSMFTRVNGPYESDNNNCNSVLNNYYLRLYSHLMEPAIQLEMGLLDVHRDKASGKMVRNERTAKVGGKATLQRYDTETGEWRAASAPKYKFAYGRPEAYRGGQAIVEYTEAAWKALDAKKRQSILDGTHPKIAMAYVKFPARTQAKDANSKYYPKDGDKVTVPKCYKHPDRSHRGLVANGSVANWHRGLEDVPFETFGKYASMTIVRPAEFYTDPPAAVEKPKFMKTEFSLPDYMVAKPDGSRTQYGTLSGFKIRKIK